MKHINRYIFILAFLLCKINNIYGYITVASTKYSLEVGIDKYLSVPNAYYGCIEHAVWSCSCPEIVFREKSESGAIVQISNAFVGTAMVEVIATEKYLDRNGKTRALTYYKQYFIECAGGEVDIKSEIILPTIINLEIGETKQFKILSENCYNNAFTLYWKSQDTNHFVTYEVNYLTGDIDISGVMEGEGVLTVKTNSGDERDCKISVSAGEMIVNRRTEKSAIADIKSLIAKILPHPFFTSNEDISGDTYDTDYSIMDNVLYIEKVKGSADDLVKLSVKMKNNVAVQGFQFDLYLPNGVSVATDADGLAMAEVSTKRTTNRKTDYFSTTKTENNVFRVLCGSSNGFTFDGNDGEVALITLKIADYVEVGEYPIILKEVKLSDNDSKAYLTNYMKSTLKIIEYTSGDVNDDNVIDVADFISVANHILGKTPSVFIIKAADVNKDSSVDVADFISVANMILNGSLTECLMRKIEAIERIEKFQAFADVNKLDNAIYVEPMAVNPGGQYVLSVKMKNASAVAGYQFTLQLPDGISVAEDADGMLMSELSTARITTKKTYYFNSNLQPDGTLKVLCGSSTKNQNTGELYTFEGNDGEVARITIVVPEEYEIGDYMLAIKDAIISDASAMKTNLEDIETLLTVGESYIVLDENSTKLPEASDGDVQIKVKCTIKASTWSTICLPFAMTEEQVYEAFGEDVQLAEFMEYEYDEESAVANVIFESALLQEDGLFANYPYIIKTSKDVTEFVVTSIIEPDDGNARAEFTNGRTGPRKEVYGTFYGTLKAGGKVPAECLFLNDGNFWYSKGNSDIKAFRGYFEFVDLRVGVGEDASANMRIALKDDNTGIQSFIGKATEDIWYTLQGVKISEPTSKGIYINNGKKILVK